MPIDRRSDFSPLPYFLWPIRCMSLFFGINISLAISPMAWWAMAMDIINCPGCGYMALGITEG